MARVRRWSMAACLGALSACGGAGVATDATPTGVTSARVPLSDLRSGNYLGFAGGLYPGGSNALPSAHATAGLARAVLVEPLDPSGRPSPTGRYALLSIGMSNTTQEFCSQGGGMPCEPWTFMGQAAADPEVNRTTLVLVNGAQGGRTAEFWDSPGDPDYDRVRDTVLARQGLGEAQVQIAWVKVANPQPRTSLPADGADAYRLVAQIGAIARALKVRYPNLRQVFLSSRIFAGYATTALNPEPYAYESGFAVKWVIEAQIRQMQGATADARAGDLSEGVAPWLGWGPYLWADGLSPRSDGLVWDRADFAADGTHPAASGERKVATLLLDFFKRSPQTRCWFVAGLRCP